MNTRRVIAFASVIFLCAPYAHASLPPLPQKPDIQQEKISPALLAYAFPLWPVRIPRQSWMTPSKKILSVSSYAHMIRHTGDQAEIEILTLFEERDSHAAAPDLFRISKTFIVFYRTGDTKPVIRSFLYHYDEASRQWIRETEKTGDPESFRDELMQKFQLNDAAVAFVEQWYTTAHKKAFLQLFLMYRNMTREK